MSLINFVEVAGDLELAGLLWVPEIGDEVSARQKPEVVSVLVDPQGLSPEELRTTYLWLPTVEQMVLQLEARQTILFHAGLELSSTAIFYKTVIKSPVGPIETTGGSLRLALGNALRNLLLSFKVDGVH